jgi:ABC-type sugar transport system substrate-binding protein
MKQWTRWMRLIAAIAVAVVAVSSIAQAIRQDSWAPLITVGWLPGVVAATWWPGMRGRCRPRRQGTAG